MAILKAIAIVWASCLAGRWAVRRIADQDHDGYKGPYRKCAAEWCVLAVALLGIVLAAVMAMGSLI